MGTSQTWFNLEIGVTLIYTFTMLLMLIKSRFMTVGIDQKDQFNPFYMSLMINRICEEIDFDLLQTKRTFRETRNFYVGKRVKIRVYKVNLNLLITEEGWRQIFENKVTNETYLVPPEDSQRWIQENIKGNFSRADLDQMRLEETASLDMMMNTAIIYHCESLNEMQIAGLILFSYLQNQAGFKRDKEYT